MMIKRFNENISNLDIQYFKECFIEFLDDTKENYTTNEINRNSWHHKEKEYWHIQIFFPPFDVKRKNYIDDTFMIKMSEHNDLVINIIKDINVSVEKVKIKYTNSVKINTFSRTLI